MFLLVDCNNFYASCEIVFQPKLKGKALVVLSNNDGCVIARSKEAKEMNIAMGEPIFLYKSLIKQKKLHVFSSNFALYGDMSQRIQQILFTFDLPTEIYSIDEAFLFAEGFSNEGLKKLAISIRKKIKKWCGIPVSIGIGKTKTLAKVANKIAKKSKSGVCLLSTEIEIEKALKNTKIEDVWGIGFRYAKKLKKYGIYNAKNLTDQKDEFIKTKLTVMGLRTALELRGKSCIAWEDVPPPRQSILCSRSFSNKLTSFSQLKEAVSYFVSSAAQKLRDQKMIAGYLSVFITTSPFDKKNIYYGNSSHVNLSPPTSFTGDLIKNAHIALKEIFKAHLEYKKAGVLLGDFSDENLLQQDLFTSSKSFERKKRLSKAVDKINRKQKKQSVFFASEGIHPKWNSASTKKSPKYTSSWEEILKIQ